jgi:two-component system, chemotaxis family, response regulator PixH
MITVLLVEDTLSEMELMKTYLMEGGYNVITAENGKEGLRKTIALKPNLIITDLVMPDMSGLELCRSLKKNPNTKELPIIACTSKNQDIDKMWGMKQGINVYITKPYSKEQILDAIKSLLINISN